MYMFMFSVIISLQFDRTRNTDALYVNGVLVYSIKVEEREPIYQFFDNNGFTGVWYDFYVYKEPLTQRYYHRQLILGSIGFLCVVGGVIETQRMIEHL